MLIIGSNALNLNLRKEYRKPKDIDYICTEKEWQKMSETFSGCSLIVERSENKGHIQKLTGEHMEFNISNGFDSNQMILDYCDEHQNKSPLIADVAPLEVCLLLKLSHRYKRNSKFFRKTMRDIQFLKRMGVTLTGNEELLKILQLREKETYTYSHPKLNVSSKEFFTDNVNYVYDHDSIHDAVKLLDAPAFTYYMKSGEEVMTSREKFESVPLSQRIAGVYEEVCVLALERSQIPSNFKSSPEKSFMLSLEKVCTSITSGWFREFAYDNYDIVVAMYEKLGENDYIERFKNNFNLVKGYKA